MFGTALFSESLMFRTTYSEPPYIRSCFMFGTALFSESPYVLNFLMFRTALFSEPPFVRNRLIFGTSLCSEPPYIWNLLLFGTALYLEPPYVRNRLIFGTSFCSEPPYIWNLLMFGTALYSEPPYVRSYAVIFITAETVHRDVQHMSAHASSLKLKGPLCLSGARVAVRVVRRSGQNAELKENAIFNSRKYELSYCNLSNAT
jgi:hypothetical protein